MCGRVSKLLLNQVLFYFFFFFSGGRYLWLERRGCEKKGNILLSFCLLLTLNSPCLAETYRVLLPFLALNTPFKSLHFIIVVVVSFFFSCCPLYILKISVHSGFQTSCHYS